MVSCRQICEELVDELRSILKVLVGINLKHTIG